MSPPIDIVAGRGKRGDRCSACGWEQVAEQVDNHAQHVVWSKHWSRYLCGHCLNKLLNTMGRLRQTYQ